MTSPLTSEHLDETIGRVVYEELVRLTFLSGRGLTLPKLMERFLRTIRPRIPARGLWLHAATGLIACDADAGLTPPPTPSLQWRGMAPEQLPDGRLIASVLPEVVLDCLSAGTSLQRAGDVITLFARILALAWQAETVACPEFFVDDYKTAKSNFQKRWLSDLLERYHGNISACARVAGLSRVTLYELMREHDVRPPV
jgi:hypothetical protein